MARVGCDIDGVLYPFDEELRNALVRNGYPGRYTTPTRWEFYEDWGMSRAEFVSYCNEFTDSHDLFWDGEPYPGSKEQLDRLREAGHTVVFITNRNFGSKDVIEVATEEWLDKFELLHRGDDEIHFVEDKTKVNVDYHIDDNVDNVRSMSYESKVMLCDRPWNRKVAAFSIGAMRGTLASFVNEVLRLEADKAALRSVSHGSHSTENGSNETRVTSSTGGQKGTKPARFDLLPPSIWEVAELYGKGAEKYDDWNWRKGYPWHLSYAAMQRHANLFWGGEDVDPETGCHHLTSVIFHALTLLTFKEEHPDFDDRFKRD